MRVFRVLLEEWDSEKKSYKEGIELFVPAESELDAVRQVGVFVATNDKFHILYPHPLMLMDWFKEVGAYVR